MKRDLTVILFLLLLAGNFFHPADRILLGDAVGTPDGGSDRVVVADSTRPEGERVVTGTIRSITGAEGVTIQSAGSGETFSFPMTTVLDIVTERSPSHAAGETFFDRGIKTGDREEFSKALLFFREARRNEEERAWSCRLLTARIVDCLVMLGDGEQAAEEFFLLCRADPLTPHLSSVPLPWSDRFTSSSVPRQTSTAEWLEPEKNPTGKWNPAGRLLAASILLSGPDRKKGIAALQELAGMRNPFPDQPDAAEFCRTVSLLAAAQLWRMKLPLIPNKGEVEKWEKALDRFPVSAAAGPTYVVARALEKAGDQEGADDLYQRIRIQWPAFRRTLEGGSAITVP